MASDVTRKLCKRSTGSAYVCVSIYGGHYLATPASAQDTMWHGVSLDAVSQKIHPFPTKETAEKFFKAHEEKGLKPKYHAPEKGTVISEDHT